jgi:hypothetical protein
LSRKSVPELAKMTALLAFTNNPQSVFIPYLETSSKLPPVHLHQELVRNVPE